MITKSDAELRNRLYDLAVWMAGRIREGVTTHSTQDLHNVVSAYFILKPYESSAALASGYAGFSNNPDDVAEPGLLSKP